MRRKSIGATSQAFHEPMSTGAFLEFLTRLGCRDAGLRGLLARSPNIWGPAQRLKCWSKDGNPASPGTVKLCLAKPSNAPRSAQARVLVRVAVQAPGGLGPGIPTKTTQTSQILLAKAWVSTETAASEVGTWRETKPGYPPYPPPPPPTPPRVLGL